jgi:hypothetical protein
MVVDALTLRCQTTTRATASSARCPLTPRTSQAETDVDDGGVTSRTLVKLARRIRSSILKLDSEVLRDTVNSVAEQSDLSRVRLSTTKYILGPDLMFTSWANLGLYDAAFCGTRPCYARVRRSRSWMASW